MDKAYLIEVYGNITDHDPVFFDASKAEIHADELRDAEGLDEHDRDCIRVVEFKVAEQWPDEIWEQRKPDPTRKKRRPRWFWVPVNWFNYFSHLETQRNHEEYEPYDFSRDY